MKESRTQTLLCFPHQLCHSAEDLLSPSYTFFLLEMGKTIATNTRNLLLVLARDAILQRMTGKISPTL